MSGLAVDKGHVLGSQVVDQLGATDAIAVGGELVGIKLDPFRRQF